MANTKTPEVVRFIVTTHTGSDDKDRENGVSVQIVDPQRRVVLDLENHGRGLVFRSGDDNPWDRPARIPFNPDDSPRSYFWVQMTGDDGDWDAAFSIHGITADGQQIVLMHKTEYRRFLSGRGSSFSWPLTYGSRRGVERLTIER